MNEHEVTPCHGSTRELRERVIRQNSVQPRNQQLAHFPQPANLL
jgi:hypothetical protein